MTPRIAADIPSHLKNCAISPDGVRVFADALSANPALLELAREEHRRLVELEQAVGGDLTRRCVISARSKSHLEAALALVKEPE